jgi:hypothetical protein
MARRDLVRTTASVDGVPLGEFRAFSGGELTSADVKSVSGAGQTERARGGRQTVGNVTVTREDDGSVDLTWLGTRRGKGVMRVTRQKLDADRNPIGPSIVYTGVLLRVAPGEGDAAADNDLDEFELEMSCDGGVS